MNIRTLKALADETRIRIVHVLSLEELSGTEIAATLNLAQPRVSTALSILRDARLLAERRDGRRSLIRVDLEQLPHRDVIESLLPPLREDRQSRLDRKNLKRVVARREEGVVAPSGAAGEIGRQYLPGRTWEGFARGLLELIPSCRIVDVGVGDGDMTMLLASFATELIAVDPSEPALARVKKKAKRMGIDNLQTRQGANIRHTEYHNIPIS